MTLDNTDLIAKIDKSDMIKYVVEFPEQILEAIEIANKFEISGRLEGFSKILVTGMGGSGIPGDFLRVYLKNDLPIPLIVNKDYTIPRFVDEETLVFAVSYSGTTEETIAAFHAARGAGAKIIGVTSGARLQSICEKYNVPYVLVPANRQTRTSFGYLFFSVLMILQRLGIISDKTAQIHETVKVLRDIRDELGPEVPTNKNIAKSLALKLVGRFPITYGVRNHTDVVALRWRQQFNENSKVLASNEAFPELNHNEIAAFDSPRHTYDMYEIILLREENEFSAKIAKRIELTKSIFESRGVSFTELWSRGVSILARLFSLTHIGDFTSIYLAVASGVDPTPVETIQRIRRTLARNDSSMF